MATASIIDAFRRLDTNHARRDAIEALVQELTNHELRELQNITAAKTFHCDIIGHLPVELVAHIFAYLDTSTPYRLQRVSRQWRHVLQSPVVVKQSLLQWYGPDLDLRQGGYTFFERKARHLHAFRHGQPNLYLRIMRHEANSQPSLLSGHTLIWTSTPNHNMLYLLDIQAWKLSILVGDAREAVVHVFASSQIVGFTTSGTTVYVSDHKGRGKKRFRVPNSSMTQSITCRDSVVSCGCLCEHYVLIFIWNYADQRGKSFTIDLGSEFFSNFTPFSTPGNGLALLLQPKDERVTVFLEGLYSESDAADTSQSTTPWQQRSLRYCQYTYTSGHAFGTRVAEICTCHLEITTITALSSKRFIPMGHWGTFRLNVANVTDTSRVTWMQFDENVFRFTAPQPTTHLGEMRAPEFLHRWNDVSISNSSPPFPILTHLGSSDCPTDKPLLVHEMDADGYSTESFGWSSVLFNDSYAIVMTKRGFHILCYETSPQYPTEKGFFFSIGEVLEVVSPDVYNERALKTI